MSGWNLHLLGCFSLANGSRRSDTPQQGQRMLAMLALNGRSLPRSVVAGRLWPESSEARALGSLRSTLWRLRGIDRSLISAEGPTLNLNPSVAADIDELTQITNRFRYGVGVSGPLDVDLALCTRELLPGWYEDWILTERERLRQLGLHTLEAVAKRFADLDQFAEAVDAALAAIAVEPLRETAHRTLIEIHLAEGNRSEAIRHFDAYSTLVREQLGVEPSAGIAQLIQSELSRQSMFASQRIGSSQ